MCVSIFCWILIFWNFEGFHTRRWKDDQLLCLKMGKDGERVPIRICARSKTERWNGGWRGVSKLRRNHLHLRVRSIISVAFTSRGHVWRKFEYLIFEPVFAKLIFFRVHVTIRTRVFSGSETPSGLHHEGFAEGERKAAGVQGGGVYLVYLWRFPKTGEPLFIIHF